MKKYPFFVVLWALNLLSGNSFCTEATPMISAELSKTQKEFQANYAQMKKNLRDLESDKMKAIQDAKAQSLKDREGIEAFKTYDLLIATRYVNDSGQCLSALEVSKKDHENLNKLFDVYLRTSPLVGRLSAGHARRYIGWAVQRLQELSQFNSEPSEKNNPDLEILARVKNETESRLRTVTELASRLGVKLEENSAVAEGSKETDRMPASTK